MRDLLRLKRWMFLALLFSVSSFAQTPHAPVGVDRSKTSARNLPSKPSLEKGCASARAGGIPDFTPSEAKSKPGTVVFDTARRTLFIAPHSGGTKELIADLLGVLTFAGLIIYLVVDRRSIGEEKRKLTLLSDSLNRSIDALGKSEQKFHLLAENVPGVIYLCRGRDRLAMQYLNSAVEHLTGYPKADFLKGEISFDALCHVSDVSKVRAEIDSAIIERRPFRLVYRLKRRSGEWRWIEESGVGIFQGESLVYLEGFLSDVTERKQAEEALSASEASYRMLFERNLAGVYRCTLEGHVIDCNEAFARMCGFANCEEVAEHKDWRFFLAGADRQAALTRLKKRGRLTNFETQLQRKDGAPIWVLENASLLKNQNGGAEFIEGTVFDISDRKRAEQMAEQFKRQNELILNSAGEGIYGMDLQGHTTFANPAAARMLGRRVSELMERSHHSLLHSSSRGSIGHDSNGCAICLTLRDGTMRHGDDGTFSRKDGTSFPAEYICTAIRDEAGNVMGAVVTFRDTTERKQLEEQLHRAQKMEAIGSLAGGVAHDFNNLLTGILGFSDIALQQIGQTDPLHGDVNEIKKAAQRAASLTRQLLAFSRQQVLAPEVLDLNAIVTDVEKMLRRLIGEDIHLVMVREPQLGRVKADPGQIEQVIVNLVVNSRDAMPHGGQLTISTSNVRLDEADARRQANVKPGSYVTLTVTDTGFGMDEQTRSRIFEPFFTTKDKGKGTGLGLATVYGIVKQSGGHLSVQSEPGRGTTFTIYLPLVEERTEPTDLAQKPGRSLVGSETILLVEDEESVRLALRKGLSAVGYNVLTASDPAEALSLAEGQAGPIHLLLTDVVMPNMSGPELAARLTLRRPEMTVLCISGYMDETVVRGALGANTAFLQKPFTQEVLASKVREVLDAARVKGGRLAEVAAEAW